MKIKFEGKIKIKETVSAKTLLDILSYLIEEKGFVIKKFSEAEVKLFKNFVVTPNQQSPAEFNPEMKAEMNFEVDTEVSTAPDQKVEIEIEASDDEFEIEIESSSLELIKELTDDLAARL